MLILVSLFFCVATASGADANEDDPGKRKVAPFEDLLKQARDPEPMKRLSAAQDLGLHWPKSKDILHSLMKDKDQEVGVMASGVLLAHGDHSGERIIDELMSLGDSDAMLPVAQSICSQEASLCVNTLHDMLFSKKKSEKEHLSAAFMLDDYGKSYGAYKERIERMLMEYFKKPTIEEARKEWQSRAEKARIH